MRRLLRWMGWSLAALFAGCVLGVIAFDLMMVRPTVSLIQDQLRAAAPSERQLPATMIDMLGRANGSGINGLVARHVVLASPNSMGTSRRMLTELGLMGLLPLHLSRAELAGAYAASAYMGAEVRGFAQASRQYLGVELDRVDLEQAARLVAIAHAPNIYLEKPERLERRTRYLLSLPGRVN